VAVPIGDQGRSTGSSRCTRAQSRLQCSDALRRSAFLLLFGIGGLTGIFLGAASRSTSTSTTPTSSSHTSTT
jgi:hypothetical protein